ncbi:MAG: phospholipase D-like domain-containing protein [Campylobacterales bacterium]
MRAVFLLMVSLLVLFADDGRYEVYFMPEEGKQAQKRVVELIKSAKNRVDIAMYSFTNKTIANAVKTVAKKGVKVRIVVDKEANINSKYSQAGRLATLKGVDVYAARGIKSKSGKYFGKMHLKLAVIDSKTTILGSANWSKSAFESSYELLYVTKNYALAKKSRAFIEKIARESRPYYK